MTASWFGLIEIPGYEARHQVRPGLTGLTQVYAPRDISRTSKFRLDRVYLKRAELLARPEVDPAVVLDHRARGVGEAEPAYLNFISYIGHGFSRAGRRR